MDRTARTILMRSVFLELKAPSAVVIHHVSPPRFVLRVTLATCTGGTAIEWAQEFEDSAIADRIRHHRRAGE